MRRFVVAALCAVAGGTVAAPVTVEAKSLRQTYTDVRVVVVKKHGTRAAGRNIRRHGVKMHAGGSRTATYRELAKSIRVLRGLVQPKQYLVPVGAGPPRVPPSMAMTARYAPTGLASCIVNSESRGDPQASNGTHFGIAQWSLATWQAHGGPRMTGAADPRGASYQQQLRVLNSALARFGCRDWCPYDPC